MKIKRTPIILSGQVSGFALMVSLPRSEVLLRLKVADHVCNRLVTLPVHSNSGEKSEVDVSLAHIVLVAAEDDWEAEPQVTESNIPAARIVLQ